MPNKKVIFTGNFGEYFVYSLGLIFLVMLTFGLLLPYYFYWQIKYFVAHLQIEA